MATSKVVYSGRTLIDLTEDTITEETLLRGYTAHKADGTKIVGTAFKDYPSRYSFLDTLQDSRGENILEKSRKMYVIHTLFLHYFYTPIPTLKKHIILFFLYPLATILNHVRCKWIQLYLELNDRPFL